MKQTRFYSTNWCPHTTNSYSMLQSKRENAGIYFPWSLAHYQTLPPLLGILLPCELTLLFSLHQRAEAFESCRHYGHFRHSARLESGWELKQSWIWFHQKAEHKLWYIQPNWTSSKFCKFCRWLQKSLTDIRLYTQKDRSSLTVCWF